MGQDTGEEGLLATCQDSLSLSEPQFPRPRNGVDETRRGREARGRVCSQRERRRARPPQAAPAALLVPLASFQASVALLWATRWTR